MTEEAPSQPRAPVRSPGRVHLVGPHGKHSRPKPPKGPRLIVAVAAIVAVLVLIFLRGHWLLSNTGLNPDEADLLAVGKRASLDLLPYKTYTTASDGFLWPFFLGILGDIGIPLTLPTAHVLSALAYLLLAFAGWYFVFRQFGWIWATAIVTPTAIYLFSGISSRDYLSLGTELLPIVILLAALLVLLGPSRDITTRRLAVAGVISGTSVWAKPQLGPLALSLLASGVLLRILERAEQKSPGDGERLFDRLFARDCLVAIGFFALPTAIFLGLILLAGTINPFFKEGVAFLFTYVGTSNPSGYSLGSRIESVVKFVADQRDAFLWMLGGVFWIVRAGAASAKLRSIQLAAWALPVLASVGTFFALSQLYSHYGNILYAGSILSLIIGVRVGSRNAEHAPRESRPWYFNGAYLMSALILVGTGFIAYNVRPVIAPNAEFLRGYVRTVLTTQSLPPVDPFGADSSNLPSLCPPNSRVLVWGWSAELYSEYNWLPASRYDDSYWQIFDYGDRAYYRHVLLEELTADPPACIVEAIGGYFFGNIQSTDTLGNDVRGADALLDSCYTRIVSSVGTTSPVAVYVKRPACTD